MWTVGKTDTWKYLSQVEMLQISQRNLTAAKCWLFHLWKLFWADILFCWVLCSSGKAGKFQGKSVNGPVELCWLTSGLSFASGVLLHLPCCYLPLKSVGMLGCSWRFRQHSQGVIFIAGMSAIPLTSVKFHSFYACGKFGSVCST